LNVFSHELKPPHRAVFPFLAGAAEIQALFASVFTVWRMHGSATESS
jgi:hypothetical protein